MPRSPSRPIAPAEAGFTLVELLVVLGIIGLLTTVVAINVLPIEGQARQQKAKADIARIEQGLQLFRLDVGRFPTAGEGLGILTQPVGAGAKLAKLPDDPWGRPYRYHQPGPDGAPYEILSLGADGEPGGSGENADIRSGA